jgi:hypothetical protein
MRAGSETMASSSLGMLRLAFQKSITRARKVFEVAAIRKSDVYLTGPWKRARNAKIVVHICTVNSGSGIILLFGA